MEQKLYFFDSYKTKFKTEIVEKKEIDGKCAVILKGTYFYPESGGQPSDTGFIDQVKVEKVKEEDGLIYHFLSNCPKNDIVECEVDWVTRFDHMQQHTGQHILSSVFDEMYSAQTDSFSIGDKFSHITIGKDNLSKDEAFKVEKMVNDIIFQNKPVKTYFADEETLSKLPLRKKAKVKNDIRIVEIEGIDYSPCGGTHVKATGEIGILKIRKWEKVKNGIRIEFVCGFRAFLDYAFKNEIVNNISNLFSSKEDAIFEMVKKNIEENKSLKKEIKSLKEVVLKENGKNYLKYAEMKKDIKIVYKIFEKENFEDVKFILQYILKEDKTIGVFGHKDIASNIIIGRSEDVNIDINKIFPEVLKEFNGKGGGNSRICQGSGDSDKLKIALDKAKILLIDQINKI